MLRYTTISIRSAISSPAKFTNKDALPHWPSGAPSRPDGCLSLPSRWGGIVTLATFTCQPREAVIGRRQENQWLGELQRGTGPLQNPLFLANVTMPFGGPITGPASDRAPDLALLRNVCDARR